RDALRIGQTVETSVEHEVLAAGQVLVEERLVRQVADPAAQDTGVGGERLLAEQTQAPAAGTTEGGQEAQEGRLARAVGYQEHDRLAGGDAQVDPRESGQRPVPLRDSTGF